MYVFSTVYIINVFKNVVKCYSNNFKNNKRLMNHFSNWQISKHILNGVFNIYNGLFNYQKVYYQFIFYIWLHFIIWQKLNNSFKHVCLFSNLESDLFTYLHFYFSLIHLAM